MPDAKVAIVTAAGRGMGAAVARELAERGYRLALMSPSGAAAKLADELGAIGVTGSVTKPADLETLVKRTMDAHGRIDALVNNTGGPPKGKLLDIPDADWHTGLDMVLLSVTRMAQLVTPIMLKQRGGAIVNITTFATFEPEAAFPVSGAMRAALSAWSKIYSDAYASQGIRINNLLPGYIDSYAPNDKNVARIPMGRYGTTREIARTVAFLLSDDAGYITGQNIRVDGGITRAL
ncbi:MAG: SDR family oxidoreductase [Alphaproteobacteria bacterium]|nr:SDR family oxidoreductase [Alphaproteobacteria bacterium]